MDASVMDVVRLLQAGPKTEQTLLELSERVAALLSGPEKATLLQQAGDLVVLMDDFADAVTAPSVAAQALCLAAELCAAAGMADHGVERLSAALDHDPTYQAAAHQLQRALNVPSQRSRLLALLTARAQTLCHMQGMEEVAAAALVQIGDLRLEADDIDRAIEAYDRALDLSPEISTVTELATLYVQRGAPGDRNQAAELYCALYDILEPEEGRPHLDRALALAPGHVGASERLAEISQSATQASRVRATPAQGRTPVAQSAPAQMASGQPEQPHVTMGPSPAQAHPSSPSHPVASSVPLPMAVATVPAPMVGGHAGTLQPPRAVGAPVVSAQMPSPAYAAEAATVRPEAPNFATNADPVPAPSVPAGPMGQDFPTRRSGRGALLYGAAALTLIAAAGGFMWMQGDPVLATSTSAATVLENSGLLATDKKPETEAKTEPAIDDAPVVPEVPPTAKSETALPAVAAAEQAAPSAEPAQAEEPAEPGSAQAEEPAEPGSAQAEEPAEPGSAQAEEPAEPGSAQAEEPAEPGSAQAEEPAEPGSAQAEEPAEPGSAPAEVAAVPEKKHSRKSRARPRAFLKERKVRFRGTKVKKKPYLAALQKALPKVERCYKRAVKKHKKLKGHVTYDVRVRRNGRVAAVRKASGNVRDRRLLSCSKRVFRKVRFPKFKKGKIAKLRVPIKFELSASKK